MRLLEPAPREPPRYASLCDAIAYLKLDDRNRPGEPRTRGYKRCHFPTVPADYILGSSRGIPGAGKLRPRCRTALDLGHQDVVEYSRRFELMGRLCRQGGLRYTRYNYLKFRRILPFPIKAVRPPIAVVAGIPRPPIKPDAGAPASQEDFLPFAVQIMSELTAPPTGETAWRVLVSLKNFGMVAKLRKRSPNGTYRTVAHCCRPLLKAEIACENDVKKMDTAGRWAYRQFLEVILEDYHRHVAAGNEYD